jgi:hypothetical protein
MFSDPIFPALLWLRRAGAAASFFSLLAGMVLWHVRARGYVCDAGTARRVGSALHPVVIDRVMVSLEGTQFAFFLLGAKKLQENEQDRGCFFDSLNIT